MRYRPAEEDHLVGGDWYDAVVLPSKQVLLSVGDVAGHGIEAATGMVVLRNALRGLAATGAGPAQLLTWLNIVAHHLTDSVTATAVCGLYDPAHPHPALGPRRAPAARPGPRGRARPRCRCSAGILLGAVAEADVRGGRSCSSSAGDTLLMYTDGLIERRDRALQHALNDLLDIAGASRRNARPAARVPADALQLRHRRRHLPHRRTASVTDPLDSSPVTLRRPS